MAWSFRRSVRLPGGFRLNLSKHGLGHSWGFRGFRQGTDALGRRYRVLSVPYTGLYNRQYLGQAKPGHWLRWCILAALGCLLAVTLRAQEHATVRRDVMLRGQDVTTCAAAICGPFSAATNFTVDLAGAKDTRPATWGTAGVQTWQLAFHPPEGYRVRVLHITGDLTAWVHGAVPAGTNAGVLWGLQTTGAVDQGTSTRADYSGDGTMLYVQASGTTVVRAVDTDVKYGGLLEADNVLVCKVATFLNDTGLSVHLEPTWVMTFQWEKI